MSKPAHWAKVAKSLATKYGLPWAEARTTYKRLKETSPRTPSLRMVSALPPKLPAKLKGVRTKKAKFDAAAKYAKAAKVEPLKLPKNVELAPAAKDRPGARPIPARQAARNQFERFLLEQGLPVSAMGRNPTGKLIAGEWRNAKEQEKLAKLLKQGYKQIERSSKRGMNGYMMPQTKQRIVDLLEKMLGVKSSQIIWNNIMRQLYGVK